jgi:hypothetical protein
VCVCVLVIDKQRDRDAKINNEEVFNIKITTIKREKETNDGGWGVFFISFFLLCHLT